MSRGFAGRTIVVFGGATGIGAATASRLASDGASVIVQYHTREAQARELCERLRATGAAATAAQADLTDADATGALVAALPAVDGFVHAVSAPLDAEPFDALSWERMTAHLDVAVKSAFAIAKAMIVRDPRPTAGVFVSSIVTSGVPPANWSAYVTAKYALLGFVRSLAADAAGRGLRLNLVSPGLTDTPLTASMDPRRRELAGRATPLKRLGTVDEAAAAIAFLLSDESSYLVGVDLPVAGGTAFG
jgi:NAD(P)-dependent dehydrogenase (short-subunit alcohol dehydrogenase family)